MPRPTIHTFSRTLVVFRPCRLRRQRQQTAIFQNMCFLQVVPQASQKHTWPTNHFGIPLNLVSSRQPGLPQCSRDFACCVCLNSAPLPTPARPRVTRRVVLRLSVLVCLFACLFCFVLFGLPVVCWFVRLFACLFVGLFGPHDAGPKCCPASVFVLCLPLALFACYHRVRVEYQLWKGPALTGTRRAAC